MRPGRPCAQRRHMWRASYHYLHEWCGTIPFLALQQTFECFSGVRRHGAAASCPCSGTATTTGNAIRQVDSWYGIVTQYSRGLKHYACIASAENGRHVDYKGISTSAEFREFRVLAAELQCVPLNSLSIATMTALFINLYNLLVVHATIANGPPRGPIQRWRWFSSAEYRIGAFRFTLDDMEHGILRANSWRKSVRKKR